MTPDSVTALADAPAQLNFTGDFDTANTAAAIDRLRLYDNPAAEVTAAVCAIRRKATGDSDEIELLRALGLAPTASALRQRPSQSAEHRRNRAAEKRTPTAKPKPPAAPAAPAAGPGEHPDGHGCHACINRRSRAKAQERAKADPTVVPHGTLSGYDYWGCRCDGCSDANFRVGLEQREKHARRRDAKARERRMQAARQPDRDEQGEIR